ncbi:MAG: peptide ABC transporter substrate-binding protein [Chloroflexota bacterium]|nr:MAG: peptide ABC transporter substrate-binding protein [Chloroflexota bacterium]
MKVRSVLLFFALCFLLVNCRQNPAAQGSELSLNLGAEPATIDPLLATDPPTIQLDQLLFANLIQLSESDGSPQPGLAREWLVSPDGLLWEFRLRDDVYWVKYNAETGETERLRPINAHDVVYSVQRLFDPRTQSGFATRFAPLIKNAGRFVRADPRTSEDDLQRFADELGVKATDDHTVQFELNAPTSAFPTIVGAWLGRVVPRENIEARGVNWTDIGEMWTSGPYVLIDREPFRFLLLEKNPHYYDSENVTIERLRFRLLPDVASALDAYLRGELDTTDPYDSIEGANLDRVLADPALAHDMKLLPGLCTTYFGFNTSKPPFDNIQLRQAFALALNRNDVVSQVFRLGEPARWFTPPQVNAAPDLDSDIGIDFDAPLAKTTLDQARVEGARLPALTFGTNTNQQFIDAAVAAIQNWRATLSAVITVEDTDFTTYLEQLRTDPPPLFRMGYCGSYPDAHNFLFDAFHSGSPYNFTKWSSPQFDQLVSEAARETDVLKRRLLYSRAEKILVEEQAAIIPLLWSQRASLTRPRVERTFAVMEGYDRIENWKLKP